MARRAEIEARFRAILQEYGRLLRRAIARTSPDLPGVSREDVEQEARLRLWQALESEKKIDRPASFLYRIAVTATIDAVRRVKARREVPLDPQGEGDTEPLGMQAQARLATRQDNPERTVDRSRLLGTVLGLLRTLPADRRRAVGLHLQGFTTREIADLMGWTEPRARNLAYRGLDDLRRGLREQGIAYETE